MAPLTNSNFQDLAASGRWEELEQKIKTLIKKEKKRSNTEEYCERLRSEALKLAYTSQYLKAGMLFLEIIVRLPKNDEITRNLAVCTRNLSHKKSTINYAKRATELASDKDLNWNTLGIAYYDIGDICKSCEAYLKALSINPNNSQALTNLAGIYHFDSKIDQSYIYATKALNTSDGDLSIWADQLTYLRRSVSIKRIEKIDWLEVTNKCDSPTKYNSFLQLLTLVSTVEDNIRMKDLVKDWGDSLNLEYKKNSSAKNLVTSSKKKKKLISGPLKVALISGDFRDHSVARFIWPLFKYVDRKKLELVCLSNSSINDSWTQKFKSKANNFINILTLSPEEVKFICKREHVDILIDLAGFTRGSNISYMKERLSPTQISWLGYPGTSGLDNIDYIFSDKYLAPSSSNLLTERILLTQRSSLCFENMDEVEITDVLPFEKRGYITFGSLNNTYKITSETLDNWAGCLKQSRNSRLFLARREYQSFYLRKNITDYLSSLGIDKSRIHFYNNRSQKRHYLDCYNEIDISLDTMPLTGGTTTVDALWMGVPVITLEGPGIHQRISSAILRHLNMKNLIANTPKEFQEISNKLCSSNDLLKDYRRNLRKEMANSILCNGKEFAKSFTEAMLSTRI
jgi:predicted O-linked N-acetylglucosamine transferase (SPINDLY family)